MSLDNEFWAPGLQETLFSPSPPENPKQEVIRDWKDDWLRALAALVLLYQFPVLI